MEHVRRVRPYCWFLLVLFGTLIILWNILSWQSTPSRALFVNVLLILHLGIYLMMVSLELKRSLYWFTIFIQLGLSLLLTRFSDFLPIIFVLLPLLLITATLMLRRAGGYLAFLLQHEQHSHEETKHLLHQLNVAHTQLSTYALRIEELTMITERQRIARDLHDTLVQGVTGLLMQMNVVHSQLQQQKIERATELVEQMMDDARATVSDARCAIGELRTGYILPDELTEVVQEEINRFHAATGVRCVATLDLLSSTPAPLCEHVLHTITEGLTNIARHAQAHLVYIHVSRCDEILTIEVRDDGIGFDPSGIYIGHYGLVGMRERAKLIGGHVEIISFKGIGTTLQLQLPIRSEQHYQGEKP